MNTLQIKKSNFFYMANEIVADNYQSYYDIKLFGRKPHLFSGLFFSSMTSLNVFP